MKPSYNFTIRVHKGEVTCLADMTDVTISNITLLNKYSKFDTPKLNKKNEEKFGYEAKVKGSLLKVGGSVSYPRITFNGEYFEIVVKGFPRFPVFTQEYSAARNALNGWGYTGINMGYPNYLLYRKIEIIHN